MRQSLGDTARNASLSVLKPWSDITLLAVLGALTLGWSGSVWAEITPRERAVQLLEEAQAHEAAPPAHAPPLRDQALPSERADDVEVREIRTPLKDVLLAALASSAPEKQGPPHVVQRGDTLGAIANRYGVTLPMLKWANRLDTDRISPGQRLSIPTAVLHIEIDKSENLLRFFNDLQLVRTYPVATGDQGVTPIGTYTIANRLIGPTWYWQGYAVPPDDPEYPLGSRWLGLSKRGYGIHGTNEPESIGQQISHGCIRMHNADVEELFDVVPVGTGVTIIE